MPFERIRFLSYRLRVRIAVWYGGAFALLIVLASLFVFQGLRNELVGETDFRLFEDAKETAQAVVQLYPDAAAVKKVLARKADNHTHERLFLQWLDVDGSTLWASKETPRDLSSLDLDKQGVFPVREVGIFRVAQRTVEHDGIPPYIIRVGASQEQINTAVWKRTRITMLIGVVSMLIAIMGAYWIAGSAIRPVTDITERADRLRPSHLKERLPIRGTGDELDLLSRTINRLLDRIADYLAKKREFVANALTSCARPWRPSAVRSTWRSMSNARRKSINRSWLSSATNAPT